jgi:hypothetical protein
MSWREATNPTSGNLITPALLNLAGDQLAYLKGQKGPVQIEAGALFHNDANFQIVLSGNSALLYFDSGTDHIAFDRVLNQYKFVIGGSTIATLDADGIAYAALYALLQPMGASRHMEWGTSAAESVANEQEDDDAFTFTKAFTKVPVVVHGLMCGATPTYQRIPRVHIKVNTLTITGVTLTKNNPSTIGAITLTSYYIAEGPD